MTEEIQEPEKVARVSQEWPATLKERVLDKVGKRGLTSFTVMAVTRHLEDGGMDLAVEARDARDLAQRLANVLATVVDSEARLTFLANVELPEWVDTRTWPDDVLARISTDVTQPEETPEPEPEPEIDPVPEMKKVGEVTMTRVDEPKRETSGVGTAEEPAIVDEDRFNNFDGPRYAAYEHVHSPDGRCLKNVFVKAGEDGKKHCPLVAGVTALTVPQEKVDELQQAPPSPVVHQGDAPGSGTVGPDSNLLERLKQAGKLVTASTLEVPDPSTKPPAEEPVVTPSEPAPHVGSTDAQADAAPSAGLYLPEQTAGPNSGPLPPVPEDHYAADAVPLPSGGFAHDMPDLPAWAPTVCPKCQSALDGGLCWACGWSA